MLRNTVDLKTLIYERSPIAVQNAIVTLAGRKLKRQRMGPAFFERLHELEESMHRPQSWHDDCNTEQLQQLLRHASEHVPYYAEVFRSLRLAPSDIRSLADLAKLPVLTKEIIRQRPDDLVSHARPRSALVRGRTSGTTGTALAIWYSHEAFTDEFATVWRLRRSMGVQPCDRNATFNGRLIVPFKQTRQPYWRENRSFGQLLFSQHHLSLSNARAYAQRLVQEPFIYWWGYPSFMGLACEAVRDFCGTVPNPPKGAFPSSENLLPWQRRVIADVTGAPVRDRYGTGELAVSMTECSAGRLHVDREMGIVEVDVRESDAESETGPLLVTGLRNYGTVFIRYQVGDVGRRCKTPCPCGRAGPTFTAIDGRLEDYVVTPDGRRVGRMDHIFKDALMVKEAQILQNSRHELRVRIVRRVGYAQKHEGDLRREFLSRLGAEMRIQFEYVDQIERLPNGKFRAVITSLPEARIAQ